MYDAWSGESERISITYPGRYQKLRWKMPPNPPGPATGTTCQAALAGEAPSRGAVNQRMPAATRPAPPTAKPTVDTVARLLACLPRSEAWASWLLVGHAVGLPEDPLQAST